jgi:hypothetical protein
MQAEQPRRVLVIEDNPTDCGAYKRRNLVAVIRLHWCRP